MNITSIFTRRNISRNKKRTIVTIIGVVLSTALICTVVGMIATFRESIIQDYKENSGDWHICYGVRSEAQYDTVVNNAHVEKAGVSQQLGFSEMGVRYGYQQYLSILGVNDTFFSQMNIKLSEGRYPENASEMLISSHYAEMENAPKVGDSVTIPVGDRVIRTEDGEEFEYNGWTYAEEEAFILKGEETYTVVGICESMERDTPYIAYVLDDIYRGKYTEIYVRVDQPSHFSNIQDSINRTLSELGDGTYDYMTNMLVRYEGGMSDGGMNMVVGLGLVISAIIVGTSIFIISNSFRISVEDKKTQFGMLASVGATRHQIRGIVFREGLYIFLIGTTLGLALGAFVIWALDGVVNLLIGDMMRMKMIFTFPWWVVLFTILLSAVTIFLSALKPARDAARITPIEIIRGGSDIKLDAKKLNTGRMSSKLFGIGGVIAEKNMKRSRKKYRTTVVSLVIAVAVFIAISGFVGYGKKLVGETYTKYDCNLIIHYIGDQYEDGFDRVKKAYEKVRTLSGVKEYFYGIEADGHVRLDRYGSEARKAEAAAMPDLVLDKNREYSKDLNNDMLEMEHLNIQLYVVPDQDFKDYLEKIGVSVDDTRDVAVLADKEEYYDDDDVKVYRRRTSLEEGDDLQFVYSESTEVRSGEEPENEWSLSSCRIVKLVDEDTLPPGLGALFNSEGGTYLLISEKHFDKLPGNSWVSALFVDAEDPEVTENAIDAWNNGEQPIYRINNLYAEQQGNDRMILVLEIFLYGFIIVITLIAVTNVFNTITTNMNLRSREFAMLRSVGMTKKEFVRMIRAEGILISLKSVLYGIPIGAVLSYLVYLVVKKQVDYGYIFPWLALVIAVAAVALIVGSIMWAAVRKIRKQNIIDAIRVRNY